MAVAVDRVHAAQESEREREIGRLYVPGGDSARELPWEFVKNEVGMLVMWFKVGDTSQPENAVISAQIAREHTPMELLERMFIRPFLKRDDPR